MLIDIEKCMHNFCMTFLYNLQVGEWGVKWDKENSGTVIILEKTNRGMNPPFASEGVKHGCACHKKVDFIPLLVLREYLLSHCSSCPIVLPSPYPLSILFYKQNSEDFFRRNLFY